MMQVTYDADADAAYISFSPSASVRQVALGDDRVLDYGADGVLVGVELLSPSLGVDLSGIPRRSEVASAVRSLGFKVLASGPAATGDTDP